MEPFIPFMEWKLGMNLIWNLLLNLFFILKKNQNKPHKAKETGQNFECDKYGDLDSISN